MRIGDVNKDPIGIHLQIADCGRSKFWATEQPRGSCAMGDTFDEVIWYVNTEPTYT